MRRQSKVNKLKVRETLIYLEEAILTATVSGDLDEIGEISNQANNKVDIAVTILPNGGSKGALIVCQKALGHSFILQSLSNNKIDPKDSDVMKILEEITIRYELSKLPNHERAAKVLANAKAFLGIPADIAKMAGINTK